MRSLAIIGEVDFGKSTLMGAMVEVSGTLPQQKIDQAKEYCQERGVEFEPAFLLDALEEERLLEKTVDFTRVILEWKGKKYELIDTPGHLEYAGKMLSGLSLAEKALLVVDGTQALSEENFRFLRMSLTLGISGFAVIYTKKDLIPDLPALEAQVSDLLQRWDLPPPVFTLAVGAKKGMGVSELMNCLDDFFDEAGQQNHISSLAWIQNSEAALAWTSANRFQWWVCQQTGKLQPISLSQTLSPGQVFDVSFGSRGDLLLNAPEDFVFSKGVEIEAVFFETQVRDYDEIYYCGLRRKLKDHQLESPVWLARQKIYGSFHRGLLLKRGQPVGLGILTASQERQSL